MALGYPDSMALHFAARTQAFEPFLAMEVMERAFALERGGARVLHLGIGEPGFPPPPEVEAACGEAIAAGETRYTDSRGLSELREAIARDKGVRAGVAVDPSRVIVTSGTSPAMLLVFSLLVDPGDEVVVGTPHYACYPNFIRFCGGTPVFVPTAAEEGYRLDPAKVAAAIGPRTRAIVTSSPANPTGAIQPPEVVHALAGLGLPLISDEIYDGLVYDDAEVTSALATDGEPFVLDGFSKRYAMTGFRLGYAIVPEPALRPLQVLQQSLFISANHFVQRAGIAAIEHGAATVAQMREAYGHRRRLLVDGLRALGFGVPTEPAGAFYVFADARPFGADSRKLAFEILEGAHVAVIPGIDFGEAGEGWLRFSCAASEAVIAEALERLEKFLAR